MTDDRARTDPAATVPVPERTEMIEPVQSVSGATAGSRPATARRLTDRARFALLGAVAAIVVVLDQLTKLWAVEALDGRDIDLVWTLRLHLIRNTGSAFGVGTEFGPWLALAISLVVAAMLTYARRVDDLRMLVLFGMIAGGAVGNLVDRLVRAHDGFMSGGVIDFVDLQWWPVFNLADSAVVLGAIGLMLHSLREHP